MSNLENKREQFERLAETLRQRLDDALESGTNDEIKNYALAALGAEIEASEIDGAIFERRVEARREAQRIRDVVGGSR